MELRLRQREKSPWLKHFRYFCAEAPDCRGMSRANIVASAKSIACHGRAARSPDGGGSGLHSRVGAVAVVRQRHQLRPHQQSGHLPCGHIPGVAGGGRGRPSPVAEGPPVHAVFPGHAPFAYGGLTAATSLGGEARDATRTMPRGIFLGWLSVLILYAGVSLAVLHAVP
jgi:hypothetical protein